MGRKRKSTARSKFKRWLAIPKGKREEVTGIGTQKDFADAIGVNNTTLSQWKNEPGFMNGVERARRQHLDEKLSEIYEALIERAKEGDPQAMKMAFKQAGRYQEDLPDNKDAPSEEETQNMSDEQLAKVFSKLVAGADGASEEDLQRTLIMAMGGDMPDRLKTDEEKSSGEEVDDFNPEDAIDDLGDSEEKEASKASEDDSEEKSSEELPEESYNEEEELEEALTSELEETDEFDPEVESQDKDLDDLESTEDFTVPSTW